VELDGKPEKGERKIADDLVLLINEVIEEQENMGVPKVEAMTSKQLFRIGLLEAALEKSPYNFDISVALLKIYD